MKYTGMAFQMGVLLAIGAFLGKKLDHYFQTERPYWTAAGVIFFLMAALYLTFKDLLQEKE
ncbi:MAG: AtpZ/AtpI family protein [Saprospiraceae bacterium]